MSYQTDSLYNSVIKTRTRKISGASQKIKVGAFLPSDTAGCIEEECKRGHIDNNTFLVCFEDGKQASFHNMKHAVIRTLKKYNLRCKVKFVHGAIERHICRVAKELQIQFDYVFLDYCGYLGKGQSYYIKQWDSNCFTNDCDISATFYCHPRADYTIEYLYPKRDIKKYLASYRDEKYNPVYEDLSLCQQNGLCDSLPFDNSIESSLNYLNNNSPMLVMKVNRKITRKPNKDYQELLLEIQNWKVAGVNCSKYAPHIAHALDNRIRLRELNCLKEVAPRQLATITKKYRDYKLVKESLITLKSI